jgi:mannose-1-phosphate guanylyltransferase
MTNRALYALILAGGSGTRLWPYSRRRHPKQLLPLLGDRSLLQATVDRLEPMVRPDHVLVLTSTDYVDAVRAQLPRVPAQQVVAEPEALGTAAAVGLGVALVAARDPGAVMAVLPADHVITPPAAFLGNLVQAAELAADGWLVTFGIRPTAPETGYGYISLGEALVGHAAGFRVAEFVEKPGPATAAEYVAGGKHLWNSGMFVWRADVMHAEIGRHLPALAERVDELAALAAAGPDAFAAGLGAVWAGIAVRTTIDYGVMERSDRAVCLPAEFAWSDVGSWAAVADALATVPGDPAANVLVGPHVVAVDTRGSLVLARGGRLVATVGVDDLVVVDTADALLVCRRDRAQDVRQVVAHLVDDALTEYL